LETCVLNGFYGGSEAAMCKKNAFRSKTVTLREEEMPQTVPIHWLNVAVLDGINKFDSLVELSHAKSADAELS
jgi:hypothetical protein